MLHNRKINLEHLFLKVFFIFSISLGFLWVQAEDLTSTSFIIKDPVLGTGSGFGTSASFQAFSRGDTLLTGVGSSASYITHYGFLYFPGVSDPELSFSISDNSISFGTLTSSSARYATTGGGSGSNSVAHTITASSNASSGYIITYNAPTLTSGGSTIAPATITGDADGTPGTAQFALSLSSDGSATIPAGYQQASNNWSFVANTPTTIASTSGATTDENFSLRYIANISTVTPAGSYSTNVTYVITGNY